jgi:nucleoside-diphosphate-sugar epimerase
MPARDGILLVTGGTGLTGSNTALAAAAQGWQVRALARRPEGLEPLRKAGIEIVLGDITDPPSLERAMTGVRHVIHTAAALGGTWSKTTSDEFWAVNHQGAINLLDAAKKMGVQRAVMIDSHSILDSAFTLTERSPVILIKDVDSPYVRAKRAAYYAGMHRAAQGQDIVYISPGAIFGPGPLVERALHPTSFTAVLLLALTAKLDRYLTFPMFWTFVPDLVQVCLRALERGEIGRRYLACGRNEDVRSLAAFCNRGAELAGIPHRVQETDPKAPGAVEIGTMRQFADRVYATPYFDDTATRRALDCEPTRLDEALARTIAWLRAEKRL